MSGPSIDLVTLERQRMAELERARQERLRQIRAATAQLNREQEQLRRRLTEIRAERANEITALREIPELRQTLADIENMKRATSADLERLLRTSIPTEPQEILALASTLQSEEEKISKRYYASFSRLAALLDGYQRDRESLRRIVDVQYQGTRDGSGGGRLLFGLRADPKAVEALEPDRRQEFKRLFGELEELLNSDALTLDSRQNLSKLAAALEAASREGRASLPGKLTEAESLVATLKVERKAFELCYEQYYASYVACLEAVNRERKRPFLILPKPRHCFSGVDALQRETRELDAMAREVTEHAYIRAQIDEVMRGFGYDTAEEIVFDTNQRGSHYRCKSLSDKTEVHIHVSERDEVSGKNNLMMIVRGYREQHSHSEQCEVLNASELTAGERAEVLHAQGRFCVLHPRIVEALQQRGLQFCEVLENRPPDERSCSVLLEPRNAAGSVTEEQKEYFLTTEEDVERWYGSETGVRTMALS